MTDLAPLVPLAQEIIRKATAAERMIVTAESCTGGLVAAALTEIAGSSAVVDRGFVTYSNEAKHAMLGVDMALIEEHGAVSEEVAIAMAEGALARSNAQISVSITGIAGPGGGTPDKPVGLVHFASAAIGAATVHHVVVFGDQTRSTVRLSAARQALTMLTDRLANP